MLTIRPDTDPAFINERLTVVSYDSADHDALKLLKESFAAELLREHWDEGVGALSLPRYILGPVMEQLEGVDFRVDSHYDSAILPGGALYQYQVENVDYTAAHLGRAFIADDVGLGKTASAIAWLHRRPDLRPALIVCPASVKIQWVRNLVRWLGIPLEEISMLKSRKAKPIDTPLAVINYDVLRPWLSEFFDWAPKVVIFDEIHKLKEERTARSKASLSIARFPSMTSVLGLSGTPVKNRPRELWHPLLVLNPTIFPNYYQYANRYCSPERIRTTAKKDHEKRTLKKDGTIFQKGDNVDDIEWNWVTDYSGASNLDELETRLKEQVLIRHLRQEVPIPRLSIESVPFECDLKEYLLIREESKLKLKVLREQWLQVRADMDALPLDERLPAQAERAEVLSTFKIKGYLIQEITALKVAAANAMVGPTASWVEDFLDTGNPLLLFCHHREVAESLFNRLTEAELDVAPRILNGTTTLARRQQIVDEFAAGQYQVVIAGLQAMQEGVDGLQERSSHVALMELGWSPSDHRQAIGRLWRQGQYRPVTGYYLLAAGTIYEDIANMVDIKSVVTGAMFGEIDEDRILEHLVDSILEDV